MTDIVLPHVIENVETESPIGVGRSEINHIVHAMLWDVFNELPGSVAVGIKKSEPIACVKVVNGHTLQQCGLPCPGLPQDKHMPQPGVMRQRYQDGLVAYYTGDYPKALSILRPLAEQGDARAQNKLGFMFAEGQGGVSQDFAEALKWYLKAAEQGDAGAQYYLGAIHTSGQGVPQNYVEAHMWYNLAAAQGHKVAGNTLDLLSRLMTPAQIAEAQRMARDWMAKHPQ